MKTRICILLALVLVFAGCEDVLSPADENNRELESIYEDAAFAEGLLLNGYLRLPQGSYSYSDVATDNAVTNNVNSSYLLMATGRWSAMYNPTEEWTGCYAAIQYLNIILAETDSVNWAITGKYVKEMFNDRTKGEAYGLRAYFMYYLLQAHGGYTADGQLMGVPIYTKPVYTTEDFTKPRNTFKECLQQINSDLKLAESYLPLDFEDVTDSLTIPAKYLGKTTVSDYNRVFGAYNHQRLTSRIVKGIRAKVALLAASPAFSQGTSVTWEEAANAAAEVLNLNGGVTGIAKNGWYWFAKANASEITALAKGVNPPEVLWRTNVGDGNALEVDNYPPSLYGQGYVNPTQNLVDAFPMLNGYPISDPNSGYDANNPYANRDPRLAQYIVVNGSKMGPKNTVIYTKVGQTKDGLNSIPTSTRTGYYLRKLLREDVNLDPTGSTNQRHYVPRIRYTELYLAYAEAANEAWGPDGAGANGFSAREVIAAIRQRAGIEQPDVYLSSINNKDDMRKLIRNERRLELCFEDFRFWDLRRWKESITEPAKGVMITADDQYIINTVENRQYGDYMYYGPIPNSEVLKWGFVQNAGW